LKNDSVINSNVTEGIPSLPPVDSKVTAYHAESKVTAWNAMRATCSARNDIREGGAINEVACHIGADSIKSYVTEGIPPLPPVELKG
jgi:hypothetical protein